MVPALARGLSAARLPTSLTSLVDPSRERGPSTDKDWKHVPKRQCGCCLDNDAEEPNRLDLHRRALAFDCRLAGPSASCDEPASDDDDEGELEDEEELEHSPSSALLLDVSLSVKMPEDPRA